MMNSKFKVHPFGKYVLMEEIASGGMAVVYKALGKTLDGQNHYFAIKRILPNFSSDEEFISLMKDEAKLMVQLNHPNIVSLIEFGKVAEDYYISMEYVEGTTLKGMIQRVQMMKHNFTFDMAAHIIREIATGLSYAHRKMDEQGKPLGIVHRDISPANILVSYEGEVKITDFGISKATTQTHFTQSGIIRGKTGYMSPEQTRSDILIDLRSDLFSLGVIFYELLTGKKLFYAKSIPEAIRLVREGNIPSISSFRSDIPKELEKIVFKILEQKPENRFQKAEDLMDALNEFLTRFSPAGRPIRITHVDLVGFMRRFYPQEMSTDAEDDAIISKALSEVTDEKPALLKDNKFYETSKTYANNPLYEISSPIDTSFRVSVLTSREGQVSSESSRGSESLEDSFHEVTEADNRIQIIKKKIKKNWLWVSAAVFIVMLAVGYIVYDNHKKQSYQTINISSDPAGAQVWLDGILQSKLTPAEFLVPKNKNGVVIGIRKKGYQLIQQTRKLSDLQSPIVFRMEQDEAISALSKVLLNTEPTQVKVFLNGEEVKGLTPIELQLEVGKTYQLKFEKEGYNPKDTTLTVDVPGNLEKTVYLTQVKKTIVQQTGAPIAPPTKLGGADEKVVRPGSLSITSNPWSYIDLDGKRIGETPLVGFSTSPGKHQIKLYNSELNIKSKDAEVTIESNVHLKCTYDFDKDDLKCF